MRRAHASMSLTTRCAAIALLLGLGACGSLVPSTDTPRPPLREDFRPPAAASAPASAASGAASALASAATPTATPTVNAAATEASTAAAHEWRGFFADARLDEVVALALDQNRSLRASAAAV